MMLTIEYHEAGVNVNVDAEHSPAVSIQDAVSGVGIALAHLLGQVPDSIDRLGLTGQAVQIAASHLRAENDKAHGITR
jgi:hypothetical protein